MSSLRSKLYKAARLSGDVSAVTSASPKRIARRARNKVIGRVIPWNKLWK